MTHVQTAASEKRAVPTSWNAPNRAVIEAITLEDSVSRVAKRLRWYGFPEWFIAGAAVTDHSTVSAALADGDGRAFVVMNVDRRSGTVRPTVLDLRPLGKPPH